jgi:hypothetical protein
MATAMSENRDVMKLMTVAMSEIACRILLYGARDERQSRPDEAHDRRHERDGVSHPVVWRS